MNSEGNTPIEPGEDTRLNIGSPSNKPKFSKRDKIAAAAATVAIAGGGAVAYLAPGGWHGRASIDETPPSEITANLFVVPQSGTYSADGTTNCVRSSSVERTYAEADANNNICGYDNAKPSTSWEVACAAASAGDEIGVMPGRYEMRGSGGYLIGAFQAEGNSATPYDCAKGGASDYNPNWREQGLSDPSSVLTNWVLYKPGVDCAGTPNINFSLTQIGVRSTFASANWHIIVGSPPGDTTNPGGECFDFNRSLYIHDRNTELNFTNVRPSNIIFRGRSVTQKMEINGLDVFALKNFWIDHADHGPNLQCVSQTGPYTSRPASYDFKCLTQAQGGPYFESWMANLGTNITGCDPQYIEGVTGTGRCAGFYELGANGRSEPYIHGGVCCGAYTNVRISDMNVHDGQAKGTGGDVHPGCWMFDGNAGIGGLPSHNMVLDGISCERQVIGVQHADSGVTVQNSYFACPATDLPNSTPPGKWDQCGAFSNVVVGCRDDITPGCVTSNVLYRNNVFFAMSGAASGFGALCFQCFDPGNFITYSNVRAIGNIFIGGNLVGCGTSGVTCANNSVYSASATGASNTTTLTCDPTIDSNWTTPDNLWRDTTQLNPRLSGTSCNLPTLDQTALNTACSCTDYSLGFDIDGDVRNPTSTAPGVDAGNTTVTIMANLFAVPATGTYSSDGATNCVSSSTLKTYAQAKVASPKNVCSYNPAANYATSWDAACNAAAANSAISNEIIGVMPGVYRADSSGGSFMFGGDTLAQNCAPGASDYNPNWREQGLSDPSANLNSWVKFIPGTDVNCTATGATTISFAEDTTVGRVQFANGNWHAIFEGDCFNFNRTFFVNDRGCDTCGRPQNLILRGNSPTRLMQWYGLELIGGKNMLFENIDYGPGVQCTSKNGPYTGTAGYDFACNPSGPYFEDWLAFYGTNLTGCNPITTEFCGGYFGNAGTGGADQFIEPYIHGGAYGQYQNLRLQNFHVHDTNARGTGGGVHPGCFMFDGNQGVGGISSHNMVFDGMSCERVVIGIQHADSGVTIQNSYFGCPTVDLPNTTPQGKWDQCGPFEALGIACRHDLFVGSCVNSNTLIRYNVFFANSLAPGIRFHAAEPDPGAFGSYSNVRVIGNIFIGADAFGCGFPGITCANNAVFGGATVAGGSGTVTLTCDPFVDSQQATSDGLWRETTQLDPRLSGASCNVPTLNPSVLGVDYQLDHTIDGTARSTTATRPGVDE